MADKIYKDDIGTILILDTKSTLTGATEASIKYKKPDGIEGTWVGEVFETTKVKYVVEDGDLDMAGKWTLQVYVELASWKGRGEAVQMKVYGHFNS